MRLSLLTASILSISTFFTPSAHAQDIAMGDCLGSVEDLYMAMEADLDIRKDQRELVETALNRAVKDCEAGNEDEGFQAIRDANDLYEAAISEVRGDVTPSEFWQKADYYWGNRSYRKGIQFTQSLISCDEKMDYVAWYLNLDNPDNPGFEVLAVTKNDLGDIKTAHVTLPLDDSQYAVCTAEGAPDPEIYLDEQADEAFAKELGTEVCPQIIRVDDGMCDNIRLMWPQDDSGEEVPFVLHRN